MISIMKRFFVFLIFWKAISCFAQPLERALPEALGVDPHRLQYADEAILQAIDNNDIPGAVLAVVYRNKMIYLKAFGNKQVYPTAIAMDTNTVFDMASVTKPVATAISIMILVEQGKLLLSDKVNIYIPGFQGNIRIVDLLTHTSGLPSYVPVDSLKKKSNVSNSDVLIQYIANCRRDFKPKTDFQYSYLNFIALQHVIESISGQSLRDFAKANIFDVLGMTHTDYCPAEEMLEQIAPTVKLTDGSILHGIVHDPLARFQNGISGNAGMFSNAEDLAILSAALLNNGEYNGKRILSPQGVKAMTTVPIDVINSGRALGWDVSSDYASNQGNLLSPNTYGHTGYTGTSLVIDPDNNLAVIFLTNRVHPEDRGSISTSSVCSNKFCSRFHKLRLISQKQVVTRKQTQAIIFII